MVTELMIPLFSWLHLSDIHFGHGDKQHGWDQQLVITKLLEDINHRSEYNIPNLNCVFVTGDIAFSGATRSKKEYEQANAWLTALTQSLALRKQDLYLVPGNHDVQRNIHNKNSNARRLIQELREGRESIDVALASRNDKKFLVNRLKNYLNFSLEFGPADRSIEQLYWVHTIDIPFGLSIRIAGLNTALLCQDDKDEQKLFLGKEQLSNTFQPGIGKSNEIAITLTHHPLEWLRDSQDVSKWIRSESDIHLSGHVHIANSEELRRGSGTNFIHVVSGAVHNERQQIGVPEGHGYSYGSIQMNEKDGALFLLIWPRRWSSENTDFRVDVEKVPKRQDYAIHSLNKYGQVQASSSDKDMQIESLELASQSPISQTEAGKSSPNKTVYIQALSEFEEQKARVKKKLLGE